MTKASPRYTAEQMEELLNRGARGYLHQQAAAHLVTFTSLLGTRTLEEHCNVYNADTGDVDTDNAPMATVSDWPGLLNSSAARLAGSATQRLLTIAWSLARGEPVNLAQNATGLGHAHARRLAEAVLIAAGGAEFYTFTGTEKLDELNAFHAEIQGLSNPK